MGHQCTIIATSLEGTTEKTILIMKYHLYDENYIHKGSFNSIQELRNFLCDRKYDISCDADMLLRSIMLKYIGWHQDVEELQIK